MAFPPEEERDVLASRIRLAGQRRCPANDAGRKLRVGRVVNAATGRMNQWLQEGPQLVAAQEPQPDFPPAKADIRRSVRFELQAGQTISSFSSLDRNSTSNSFLHFLHLNS